jgi:hypothetical protein
MELVTETISLAELARMAGARFGDFVKAVVDVTRGCMAVDAELDGDQEALLLERGSRQEDLWGINLYPGLPEGEWVEFDSMINLRPGQGNRTRGVEQAELRMRIQALVRTLVAR